MLRQPSSEVDELQLREIYERTAKLFPYHLCRPSELTGDLAVALIAYLQSDDFHNHPDREYIGPRLLHFYQYLIKLVGYVEGEDEGES